MSTRAFFLLSILVISCSQSPIEQTGPLMDTAEARETIHSLLDDWHDAAAHADGDGYFGLMSENAIYLGTDKTERWKRDELREWSQKAFERDTAWAFTPYDREIYFAENGRTAWFEELLETWMGPCRGSGVLMFRDSLWTLDHYNLAMLIDNDDVSAVLEVIQRQDALPDSLLNSQ